MFASALQPHELEDTTRAEEEPKLRTGLIEAQLKLRDTACCSVLVVLAGPDGAGKGPLLFRLYEWLDSRTLRTNAYHLPIKADQGRSASAAFLALLARSAGQGRDRGRGRLLVQRDAASGRRRPGR